MKMMPFFWDNYTPFQMKRNMNFFIFLGIQGQGSLDVDNYKRSTSPRVRLLLPWAPGKINEFILHFFWKRGIIAEIFQNKSKFANQFFLMYASCVDVCKVSHARIRIDGIARMTCVTRKQTLRSLSLSYQKKDGRAWPRASFFWYDTDFLGFECFDFIDHILEKS